MLRWATRTRFLLGGLGALVLFALVDRGPMWPGVVVTVAGELLQLWASAHLRKNTDLVRSGPYGWLRNPMYVGRFFVGLGLAMLTWRWFVILPYIIGFCTYAQARVLGEEVRLQRLFGFNLDENLFAFYLSEFFKLDPNFFTVLIGQNTTKCNWQSGFSHRDANHL